MKRKFIRVFLVVLVLVGVPLIGWRMYLTHVINTELAKIRAAGLPTNGEELNRWYPAVPDNQNAALVLTQEFALLKTINTISDERAAEVWKLKDRFPRRADLLTTEQVNLIRWYVETNQLALRKAAEVLMRPASRYPIDCSRLMNTELPHLAHLVNLAYLNQCAAALAILKGRNEDATADIANTLELSRTLDNEPLLISQLVRLLVFNRAFMTLECRANAGTFNPDEIRMLNSAFAKVKHGGAATHGLIGERAITIPYFTISRAELAKISSPGSGSAPKSDLPFPCYGPSVLRLLGYYELDYGSYLLGMDKALTLLSNPPPLNLKASGYFARVCKGSEERLRTMSAQTFATYTGIPLRENEGIAEQRLALTALALERFRNENGKPPENPRELVPEFVAEVPEDPFSGIAMGFHRMPKGYVIYSVGPDRKDNGGLEEADKKQSEDKKSYDITLTVER